MGGRFKVQIACGIASLFLACGCMPNSASNSLVSAKNSSSAGSTSLAVSPARVSVAPGGTSQLAASGGTPPYSYTILSGGGSITSTGLFTAPTIAANISILIQDSAGGSIYATAVVTSNTITLVAASPTLATYATDQFTATGGASSTYTYKIISGIGTIDASSGIYTAPSSQGYAEISATDASGNVAYAEVLVNSTGTPTSTTTTGFETVYTTNFNVLATYNSGCTLSTTFSTACNSAVNRYCIAVNSALSGYGPTSVSDGNATVTCVKSGAATLLNTSPGALAQYNALCTTKNVLSVQCLSAVNRYCSSLGFVSGFGPVEIQGTSTSSLEQVVCVNSTAATIINDTFADLEAYNPGCNVNTPASQACMYSTSQYCQSSGYVSGFGIIEDTASTASWVCLK